MLRQAQHDRSQTLNISTRFELFNKNNQHKNTNQ